MATEPTAQRSDDALVELAEHLRSGHVPLAWLLEHTPGGDPSALFARARDAASMVYVAALGGHAPSVRAALLACEARLPAHDAQRPKVPGGPWGRMAPHALVTPRERTRLAAQWLERGDAERAMRQVQLVALQPGGARVAGWLRTALLASVASLPDVGALIAAARTA